MTKTSSTIKRSVVNRREFLKLSAMFGAGLLGAGVKLDGRLSVRMDGLAQKVSPEVPRLPSSGNGLVGPASLIQSTFGASSHPGNFEAVLYANGELWHYFRDNTNLDTADYGHVKNGWARGQRISAQATGPGSIIQSSFGTPTNLGNFEVVVLEGSNLVHYFHDNSSNTNPWTQAQTITTHATGPGCIIQSTLGSSANKNFEVVVLEGSNLVHYFHDNNLIDNHWTFAHVITAQATGPGCIIQSSFGTPANAGNFEVVVQEGSNLVHYFHDNSDITKPWTRAQVITTACSGPGAIIQGSFGTPANPGNFEVVVQEGSSLVHYFHDNGSVTNPWTRAQVITTACSGPGAILQSNLGAGADKNFEVLVMECTQSVVHYWHPNQTLTWPWMRSQVILGEPWPVKLQGTRKVVQLVGEYDRENWDGIGTPPFAFNQTETRADARIRGADLGSSFIHAGRTYFLFGDTWRTNGALPNDDLDSIAYTTDTQAAHGLSLAFNPQAPILYHNGVHIDQSGFNVPLDGVSYHNQMYVFFSTGHYRVELTDLMGSSVLGRSSDGGLNFTMLYTFSTDRFINISLQTVPDSAAIGLPFAGAGLLIWASGRYRASDVYFACMPLDQIETRAGLRYFSGLDNHGRPTWATNEGQSAPMFLIGDAGELSVRWNRFLGCWVIMHVSGNPYAALERHAVNPWGPWSDPVIVVDPADALCHYVHRPGCDHTNDTMFYGDRSNQYGGLYGPYQIANYSTGLPGYYSKIHFAMSTWNPYSVMQMSAVVTPDGLPFNIMSILVSSVAASAIKFARLSLILANQAMVNQTLWDNPDQGSLDATDYVEWGSYHTPDQMRLELQAKFNQLLTRIPLDANKVTAYALLSVDEINMGGGLPGETANVDALHSQGQQLLQNVGVTGLLNSLNQRTQQPAFLPADASYLPLIDH